jgi:hypothetical protein
LQIADCGFGDCGLWIVDCGRRSARHVRARRPNLQSAIRRAPAATLREGAQSAIRNPPSAAAPVRRRQICNPQSAERRGNATREAANLKSAILNQPIRNLQSAIRN